MITKIVKKNLPDTLFWEYDDVNLLPNSVLIDEFSNNPDSCPPLRNMFGLADIDDIKASIDEKRQGTNNQFQHYLHRFAMKLTIHVREI